MIDLCLRAPDEAALADACPFLRGEDADGAPCWQTAGAGYALDVIGAVTLVWGTVDEDGNEITPPVIDGRYHANLRCSDAIAALVPAAMIATPDAPVRVWLQGKRDRKTAWKDTQ